MRAFTAAKNFDQASTAKLGGDYIEHSEFRIALVYLLQYFKLYVAFREIDSSDDRRISRQEFVAAVDKIRSWYCLSNYMVFSLYIFFSLYTLFSLYIFCFSL